ncbi:HAAS signaling domain-containing protein [Actinoplanes couchii]|uniref:DUF1700 domain-containing protein n=1 Tax=Actinoplanes couchii TaxID=403638 RepID=A0ABQ3X3W1_9ACTN|nr:hypothetical protein [Actinoplanes couchii]MDR6322934.1 putative membrane protein [Actinoplanes couchii]GID53174.1 hypothetical protein Aco03nite_015780 [Actinoplanes couchii]
MTSEALPEAAETYLRDLRAALSDVPPGAVSEIVEDVRAHLTEAVASGRDLDEALAGLGSPQEVAAQSREELGVTRPEKPEPEPGPDPRLRALAVTIGALTAVYAGFIMALQADDGSFPIGEALLALLPALLAALPFALPPRLRERADIAAAALTTIYMAVFFGTTTTGVLFLPMVLLLWAAVIVPWRMRHTRGRVAVRLWHATAGLLVALPGLAAAASISKEMIAVVSVGSLLYIAAPFTHAVLCALGFRAAYGVLAVAGTASMFAALYDDVGFLLLAFWWFGGLYLTVGAIGWVTTPTRRRLPTPAAALD